MYAIITTHTPACVRSLRSAAAGIQDAEIRAERLAQADRFERAFAATAATDCSEDDRDEALAMLADQVWEHTLAAFDLRVVESVTRDALRRAAAITNA